MVKKLIPLALLSIYGAAYAEEAKINLNLSPVVVTGTITRAKGISFGAVAVMHALCNG